MGLIGYKLIGKIKICKSCGKRILVQGYNRQNRFAHIMSQKQICYECAFGEDIIAFPPEHMEIIKNTCVRILPFIQNKDKSMILGGKGKRKFFMRADWSLFQSNDIWTIGVIPDRYREKLQPTVFEISQYLYNRLAKNNKRCQAIACFDRYHCFRYKFELECDKSYNKIPVKWKTGDERCRDFINMNRLTDDERSIIQN